MDIEAIVDAGAKLAVKKLADFIDDESADSKGWEKIALKMTADAVSKHGPSGVELAQKAIFGLFDGESVDLDFTDLKTASDALALLQNKEADDKSRAEDFFVEVGAAFAIIGAGVAQGLMK